MVRLVVPTLALFACVTPQVQAALRDGRTKVAAEASCEQGVDGPIWRMSVRPRGKDRQRTYWVRAKVQDLRRRVKVVDLDLYRGHDGAWMGEWKVPGSATGCEDGRYEVEFSLLSRGGEPLDGVVKVGLTRD